VELCYNFERNIKPENYMDYWEVVKKRRSIRKFQERRVPKAIIDALIETARMAPSGGNSQAWQFGVVTDKDIIRRLAHAAGEQMWIAQAPLVIALCGDVSWNLAKLTEDDFSLGVNRERFTPEFIEYLRKYPDQRAVSLLFNNSAPLLPGEHIFLTAVNFGLSACWVGHLDIKEASKILHLPEQYACLFLMPVGYEKEEPARIKRKGITEVAFQNYYEEKYHYGSNKDI
jgi:nitroreductase